MTIGNRSTRRGLDKIHVNRRNETQRMVSAREHAQRVLRRLRSICRRSRRNAFTRSSR